MVLTCRDIGKDKTGWDRHLLRKQAIGGGSKPQLAVAVVTPCPKALMSFFEGVAGIARLRRGDLDYVRESGY